MTITTPARTTAGGARRRLRRLAERLTTPLVPEDFLDLVRPLHSSTDLRGRIVAIAPETPDAVTVRIRPGRGWSTPLPGQYVRIGIDVDGVRRWRTYSASTPADADGCFTITAKCVPDGIVSTHLVRAARAGTVVQLDQPAGDFILPTPPPAKVLFVTAGSGITPVMGMLRASLPELADVVLVHCAPTAEDAIFGGELRALAAAGHLRLVEIHTRSQGRLTPGDLAALVPDLAERHTWACGPGALLDALETRYDAAGISDRLHTERFQAAVIATGIGGAVTFSRSDTTVDADGATSLLDAGENAGVLMPSGCRMGVCFGCVVPLRQGAVRDLRNGDLTCAVPGDGVIVQTCVSAAAGTCELDV
ncbi:ferredoxin reductase [[Mycobacterium] nativiensis]|uniref:Ferredoxin reductase n=1 Tax=[Mycobacterium] nativiensis TaxID=2855503 RepID=A0ABU5XS67_9MYCO|nr:ferredoxin reductase [Mycolicibacter sp. MYC340]MEB3030811.1 ferredoxin reductase [Mycolicibacter sp. MYC340]